MNLIECLIQDHVRLRKSMDALIRFLDSTGQSEPHTWQRLEKKQFSSMLEHFLDQLRQHESIENRLLLQALKNIGTRGENFIRQISGDHASIHPLIDVLTSLAFLSGETAKESVHFALNQAFWHIRNHLEREETNIFPEAAKILSPELLEDLGSRAEAEMFSQTGA